MDFYDALRAVANGKRITRVDWKDPTVCVFLAEGLLKIRKADGSLHALLVQDGDIQATDWVSVREL